MQMFLEQTLPLSDSRWEQELLLKELGFMLKKIKYRLVTEYATHEAEQKSFTTVLKFAQSNSKKTNNSSSVRASSASTGRAERQHLEGELGELGEQLHAEVVEGIQQNWRG